MAEVDSKPHNACSAVLELFKSYLFTSGLIANVGRDPS
jgi:hypothetical protein